MEEEYSVSEWDFRFRYSAQGLLSGCDIRPSAPRIVSAYIQSAKVVFYSGPQPAARATQHD